MIERYVHCWSSAVKGALLISLLHIFIHKAEVIWNNALMEVWSNFICEIGLSIYNCCFYDIRMFVRSGTI